MSPSERLCCRTTAEAAKKWRIQSPVWSVKWQMMLLMDDLPTFKYLFLPCCSFGFKDSWLPSSSETHPTLITVTRSQLSCVDVLSAWKSRKLLVPPVRASGHFLLEYVLGLVKCIKINWLMKSKISGPLFQHSLHVWCATARSTAHLTEPQKRQEGFRCCH